MNSLSDSSLASSVSMPLISVRKISKKYKTSRGSLEVLSNVSFDVYEGEFFSIIGRSGAGKSTLLRILGTLEKPDSGNVLLNGKDISRAKGRELLTLRRKEIGFIFQQHNLIPVLTAFQNIELPMLLTGMPKKEREKRVHELLEKVELSNRAHHVPTELSGGEQQRVAIARALANRPRIILADEPTADLDEMSTNVILSLLRNISDTENQTLIMITHDMKVAKQADTIVKIEDGTLHPIKVERPLTLI